MPEERTKRTFYLANGRKIEGLSTQYPDVWYVPSEGSSLTIGYHIFDTKREGLLRGKKNCLQVIEDAEKSLQKVEAELAAEE